MSILATEKTQEIAADSSDTHPKKYKSPQFVRQFKHFLIDFKIINTSVSLLIAFQFQAVTTKLVAYVCKHVLKIQKDSSDLISAFVSLVLLLLVSFLFIRFIFYKYIYTEDIAKENLVKQAMVETKKDVVKSQVSKNSSMVETIKRATTLNTARKNRRRALGARDGLRDGSVRVASLEHHSTSEEPASHDDKELFTTYSRFSSSLL